MKTGQIIYQVALPVPLGKLFDYLPPDNLQHKLIPRGTRVCVPFGRSTRIGIVFAHKDKSALPDHQLKSIAFVCEEYALFPNNLCDFIEKAAEYYHHPIGEVALTGSPLRIRQQKPCERLPPKKVELNPHESLTLNRDQQIALDAITKDQKKFNSFLLEGITGSGKTEIYLQIASEMLRLSKQVLILVPEISLTPQTQARFQTRFLDAVICYHSRMTPAQRFNSWQKIRHQHASIVIGTRSAIFLPFTRLGFIVVDEEHDPSFKQQEGFRYSARDLAVLRAKIENCPIILGSATPSFESLFNAKTNKYHWLHLPKRATQTSLPKMTLLDVRHKKLEAGLSQPLLQAIEKHCQQGQVLLFINRRGFAPTFMCYDCTWIAHCQHCDARLTFHQQKQALICHHCLRHQFQPTTCPKCQSNELHPIGQGTERIENFLQERFPHVSMARIDSDVTRKKGSLDKLLFQAQNNEAQLLIGTQILAKGHHFPHLNLVAIVDADGGLFSVDFRAVEHMAQLIIQVAGRAGRVHQAGEVYLQTFHPAHPLLKHILQQDYSQLADTLLLERQRCHLPPYTHLALIRAQAKDAITPQDLLKEVQTAIAKNSPSEVHLLGPVPAPMLKRKGQFRYQLLMQSHQRKPLHRALKHATAMLETSKLGKKVRWSLDVDPLEMF